jgi:outer membrane lipoprotein-sorting protein
MLRRIPTSRLLALIASLLLVLGGGTAIAVAAIGGPGATPPPKPLAQAIHDALAAPPVQGVTARIAFTNHLVDTGSLPRGSTTPLLTGATGRLWAAADGRLRLELQSDRGDAQITSDGTTVTILDSARNAAYRIRLPQEHAKKDAGAKPDTAPSVADIRGILSRIARSADVSGATPSNVADQPAYTVRISPKHDGGLTNAAELAWDAATGTPLRAAIYASGDSKPVLSLEATHISFGPVSASDLAAPLPAGTKVTDVNLAGGHGPHATGPEVTGVGPVSARLGFRLAAPDTLVGLPRHQVRLVDLDGTKGALVTYGAGLGGIAVLQQPASAAKPGASGLPLPKVSIDGVEGEELATALGTVVRFQRDGVAYTIIGSVPPAAAEAAARGL